MKKLNLLILICAVTLYAIAVFLFHIDYTYGKYMLEEWEIIVPITFIYIIAIALLMFFIHSKRGIQKELTNVSVDNFVKSIEKTETNLDKSIERTKTKIATGGIEENNKFIGTGIIGLTRYTTFCKIIGCLALFLGVLFLLNIKSEEEFILLYGLYLIVCGAGCLLSILFINALITITKAAKIYIDKNQKK